MPKNLHELNPSAYFFREPELCYELARELFEKDTEEDRMLYVWVHSYEFDLYRGWEDFERFLASIRGKDGVEYLTNKEALLG